MSFNPFPMGTQLHVETCFGDHLNGEVVTYEPSAKMLILNCRSKDRNGKPGCNRCIINLAFCKDLKIIHEAKATEKLNEPPAKLNIPKLDQRLKECMVERANVLRSRNDRGTPRGRQLYQFLSKHFRRHELSWQHDKIVVVQQVTVAPPYRICDIISSQHAPKLLGYVKRLLDKFNAQAAKAAKQEKR